MVSLVQQSASRAATTSQLLVVAQMICTHITVAVDDHTLTYMHEYDTCVSNILVCCVKIAMVYSYMMYGPP